MIARTCEQTDMTEMMTGPETVIAPSVDLTPSAAKRVAEILTKEAPNAALRVGVDGGGCSGFQYTYNIVTEREDDDLVLERDGASGAYSTTSASSPAPSAWKAMRA